MRRANVRGRSRTSHFRGPKVLTFELPDSRIFQPLSLMDCTSLTIRELLNLCLDSDDPDAWCEFLQRVQKPVAATIIRTLGSKLAEPSRVDDLVQNTWVKLFENDRRALRGIESTHENAIFAFAKKTAYRVTLDYLRDVNRVRLLSIDDDGFIEPPNSGWMRVLGDLRREDVDRCLKTLSGERHFERDYAIFWLHYEQGYTLKEVARFKWIGLSEKGVEGVVYRLVHYIKKELGNGTAEPSTN